MEQDDIDFDEEELEGERGDKRPPPAVQPDEDEDVQMATEETYATDQMDESSIPVNVRAHPGPARGAPIPSSSRLGSAAPSGEIPPAPAPQRRRMVITHDQYMTLQSMIVLHLTAAERGTTHGVDRDELIDWYLELKESEIQDVEQLEYEKELISKMLRKLVRVRFYFEQVIENHATAFIRITIS